MSPDRELSRRAFLGAAGLSVAATALALAEPAIGRPTRGSTLRTWVPRRAIPAPTSALVTRWSTDPWSRGSYSALPVGGDERARSVLQNTVIQDRVVLAGEYADSAHPATVNGAFTSGRRAAALILDHAEPRTAIVIGAGIAGAAAARALTDAGVSVAILEARDRIGGRIHSVDVWGAPVELGAAWVHGVRGNPITSLVAAHGLRLVPTDYEDEILHDTTSGGESPAAEAAQNRLDTLTGILEDQASPRNVSVERWLRQRRYPTDRFTAWAQATTITQEYGLDPRVLAARALQEGASDRGGDALVAGGYAAVPESLLAGLDVALQTPATSIEADEAGVTVRTERGDRRADAVVVAVPVSLLKIGSPKIAALPTTVISALRSLTTGNLEKVVLRYQDEWWPDAQVLGVVGGGAPGAPAGSLAALRWTEVFPLTAVTGFPALVAFSGGLAARQMPDTDAACVAEANGALAAAFGRS